MFYSSLLPAAIRRARTSQCLRVTCFRRTNVIEPDQELIQAIAYYRGLDGAPNEINCCSFHDNTIGHNDFTIQISDMRKKTYFGTTPHVIHNL